jgi:hypothetical protein
VRILTCEAVADLGVSGGVGGKLTCEYWHARL